jgi:hypothetical protein
MFFHRKLTNLKNDIVEHLAPLIELSRVVKTNPAEVQSRAAEFSQQPPKISAELNQFGLEFRSRIWNRAGRGVIPRNLPHATPAKSAKKKRGSKRQPDHLVTAEEDFLPLPLRPSRTLREAQKRCAGIEHPS